MTTRGGSVWDRGPSDDGERPEPDAAATPESAPPPERPPDHPPPGAPEHEEAPDGASDAATTVARDDVWSRGPTVEPISMAEMPRPSTPEPVLPPAPVSPRRVQLRPELRRPVAALVAVALVVAVGAIVWTLGVVGGDEPDQAIAGGTTTVLMPPVTPPPVGSLAAIAPEPTVTIEAPATTEVPAVPEPTPTTAPAPTTTQVVETSTTSTSTSTTSTSTTTSTTSTSTTSTTVPAGGPAVVIVGYTGPCRFGANCLIADFSIRDFPTPQNEFVCEFADGSRHTFRFGGTGAERACSTSSATGSITIEVGGIRSETISR